MTLVGALSGGDIFNNLTALNRALIAQANEGGISESTPDNSGFTYDPSSGAPTDGRPADPEDDQDDSTGDIPEFRGWAATDKFGFESVVTWINQSIDMPTGTSTLVDAFLEDWAIKWREENGFAGRSALVDYDIGLPGGGGSKKEPIAGDPTRVPTVQDLLQDDEFLAGISWLPYRAALDTMPPAWLSESMKVNEETGEEEMVPVIVVNDPLTGVNFIEESIISKIDLSVDGTTSSLGSKVRSAISSVVRQGPRATSLNVQEQLAQNPTTPGYISHFAEMRTRLERTVAHLDDDATVVSTNPAGILPHISEEEFTNALDSVRPQATSRSGGGTTRRSLEFDRNHLVSQVEDKWHRWMLEPGEAPMGIINGIVDQYIREAKAFWSGKGGQLDFDTYVTDKLRATPRYKTVFRHKLPGTTEEQFLNDYLGRISQFGQGDKFLQDQGFKAVTSGASPIDQVKRISRTRKVQNSGGFSQRLAQTLQGVGVG